MAVLECSRRMVGSLRAVSEGKSLKRNCMVKGIEQTWDKIKHVIQDKRKNNAKFHEKIKLHINNWFQATVGM